MNTREHHTITSGLHSKDAAANWPSIIYNDDSDTLRRVDPPHTEESIWTPIRHLEGTQVGTICWGLDGGDIAYSWPSKVRENYYDRLGSGEEPRNVMVSFYRKGIDYLPILISAARNIGLKFYGSFRMNDCHHRSDPRGILSSRFWQEHQQYRLWDVADARTYYNASLDYSFPEVRQRRLDTIRETLQWYDFDGIELDFCRNPYLFPPSEAWAKREMLTDLIRQIRKDMDEAEMKWGRRLNLLVRAPFSDRLRRDGGIDVDQWLDEHLMDAITMSCLLNDYNQTLEPWLSRCRDCNIAFYPCVESGPWHNAAHNHVTHESVDEVIKRHRAAAQNFFGQGASGVYMYNYPCHLFYCYRTLEELDLLTGVLSELGKNETLSGRSKQYTFWNQLPLQLESHRPAKSHQTIRFSIFDPDLSRNDVKVELTFRQAAEPNPHVEQPDESIFQPIVLPGWVTYWLNGKEVPDSWIRCQPQSKGSIVSGFHLGVHEKITLVPPASALRQGENTLAFFVPRFPEINDPYINIYELIV